MMKLCTRLIVFVLDICLIMFQGHKKLVIFTLYNDCSTKHWGFDSVSELFVIFDINESQIGIFYIHLFLGGGDGTPGC